MPGTPTARGYVIPDYEVVPDIPVIVQQLAESIDDDVQEVDDTLAAEVARSVKRDSCVRVRQSVAQALGNAANTLIQFDAEDYDHGGFANLVANNTRLTVPAGLAGIYRVTACVPMAGSTAGTGRGVLLMVNGAIPNGGVRYLPPFANAGRVPTPEITVELPLAVGDYLQLNAWQDTGATLNSFVGSNIVPFLALSMQRPS